MYVKPFITFCFCFVILGVDLISPTVNAASVKTRFNGAGTFLFWSSFSCDQIQINLNRSVENGVTSTSMFYIGTDSDCNQIVGSGTIPNNAFTGDAKRDQILSLDLEDVKLAFQVGTNLFAHVDWKKNGTCTSIRHFNNTDSFDDGVGGILMFKDNGNSEQVCADVSGSILGPVNLQGTKPGIGMISVQNDFIREVRH